MKRTQKNNAKENSPISSLLPNDPVVPLAEVVEEFQLPLPWETGTAGISRFDREGARGLPWGDGREIKTRVVGSIRTRAVGGMMIVRLGEAEGCRMRRGGPWTRCP